MENQKYTNKNLQNKAYSALIEYCKLYYPEADRNFVSKLFLIAEHLHLL
jgi:hypothetical protein